MEKTMRYILKLLWLVPLIAFVACGDDFALSTKYYYVRPENKAWLVTDSIVGVPYSMVDNNGITYNFTGLCTSHGFSEGTSGFLFIPTQKSYRENYYSTSISNYGTSFSMYLYASYSHYDTDDMHIYLTGISMHCSLASHEVTYFGCDDNNVEWTQTDESTTNKVFVNVDKLNSLTVQNQTYNEVLHFYLKDPIGVIKLNQFTDLYYAKGVGLIKYTLKSGIVFERLTH